MQTPAVSSYTESPAQTKHSLPSLLGPVYEVVETWKIKVKFEFWALLTSFPFASVDVLVFGSHLLQAARKSFLVSGEVT